MEDKDRKWEMITCFWVELLAYVACHCRGKYHAQQLSWGGELFTRVASYGTFWFNGEVPNITGSCKSLASSEIIFGSTRKLLLLVVLVCFHFHCHPLFF